MRQLLVEVSRGLGGRVLEMAADYGISNSVCIEATDDEGPRDLVMIHIANKDVGDLIKDLQSLSDVYMTLLPHGVMPMHPPQASVADQIRHVTARSPIEVWLNGVQSVGAWKGFLGYAAFASVVVWIGMFTGSIFLLVSAMLLAPFAGPAMNTALASASGDRELLWRNLVRYVVSISLTIVIAALLSILFGQETATTTMVDVSTVASTSALLPLIAGAAGALNLIQAENSSLVPGTAVGLLVAAALAPPAGLVGMAGALGRWDMAFNGVFVLVLQLVAINLAGSIVFRLYGVEPSGPRYSRGQAVIFYGSMALSILALVGLLAFQFREQPSFQRSSRAQSALDVVDRVISESETVDLIEANMRFTRPETGEQETLLGVIYVRRKEGIRADDEAIAEAVRGSIQQALLDSGYNVMPLISVIVLEPPSATPTPAGGED
ncbi:MAG: DUF389 domain-containing protein [Candidatus Promineifilaceae bacterium]|nr:DUF389 domain-containing protein [Candidatus Promineifilaceae bacterium]